MKMLSYIDLIRNSGPMSEFTLNSLQKDDGTWDAFEDDWRAQCDAVGESFEDYAPDSLGVLRDIAAKEIEPIGGGMGKTIVAGIQSDSDTKFYAACMVNVAQIPGSPGMTMRVRHLLASPLLDFGAVDTTHYANVLIAAVGGVVNLSESYFPANNIRFHLRSPGDMEFFRAFGKALDGAEIFASVQMSGAWLYIKKA